jgi:hypothetical protein
MHRAVRASTSHFFTLTLRGSRIQLDAEAMRAVDPALRLLEAS